MAKLEARQAEGISSLESQIGELRERMAHLEGLLEGLRESITGRAAAFLDQHPNVAFHSTPTYSSWLNQVELWFSKVQRDVIARSVFTSTADLENHDGNTLAGPKETTRSVAVTRSEGVW